MTHRALLPVHEVLPRLREVLAREGLAVLSAPPGAGKTTEVPPALLNEPWMEGKRLLLLEPRRVAARAAAARMASVLGEPVGETVGYRTRGDVRVGPGTRIEVVTEGVLTRLLQSDPSLEGVGAVIFDEFHERNLQGDLGLALTLDAREVLAPALRVLIMSATLETEAVSALLGGATVVGCDGRLHPVEVRYRSRPWPGRIEGLVALTVREVVAEHPGDVLVFLPGVGEIMRVGEALAGEGMAEGVDVLPLHGSMEGEAQDRALRMAAEGRRRVILATDIAETSLTLEGVRVVVDSGLARVPRYDPRTGMTRLDTVPVSRASAHQRSGRAGRTGPGVAYRLWTAGDQAGLPERRTPEILEADLTSPALELALWGVRDPASLRWLDAPPAGALSGARTLLHELGALDADGGITAEGRRMAAMGVHPRLAHLLLQAVDEGAAAAALSCDLAALLEERDPVQGDAGWEDPDLGLRVSLLRGARPGGLAVHGGALERLRREARRLRERMGIRSSTPGGDQGVDGAELGRLLALAYPDRVAMARPGKRGRFVLAGGRGAAMEPSHPLAAEPFLVAARLQGRGAEDRILLAAPLREEDLRDRFADRIRAVERVEWSRDSGGVVARREERLGALVLRTAPLADADADEVALALLQGIRDAGESALPWTEGARGLVERVTFASGLEPGAWPDLSPARLMASLEDWLLPLVGNRRRLDELASLELERILEGLLPGGSRHRLDRMAPQRVEVPSGSLVAVDYGEPTAPVLAVRLQELFGLAETPRVGEGRVPLTLHLLSPARRPVQVTRDLASFWRSGYQEVRKELRARYPKHSWPEDPLRAPAVRGVPRRR